jgi:hypothetical protein
MITSINNAGGTAACYSYDNTRWGAAVKLNSDNTKMWSVSSAGVVTWDLDDINTIGQQQHGAPTMSWDVAVTACATSGGRLPTVEELRSMSLAQGLITTNYQAGNFQA